MNQRLACLLPDRAVIRISGNDRIAFLQALLSNDVAKATPKRAVYAALLSPQGKYLHDMFVLGAHEALLLECHAKGVNDLIARLEAYRLRSKVTFENVTDAFECWATWGEAPVESMAFLDPRLDALGHRILLSRGEKPSSAHIVPFEQYEDVRLGLGIADGKRDLESEKSTLIEANFDFLNGIDWKKGCYVGQELTARMHYRGLAKKRIFPITWEGKDVNSQTLLDDDAGQLRSMNGKKGVALLKIDAVQKAIIEGVSLRAGSASIRPFIPTWMKIDAAEANR